MNLELDLTIKNPDNFPFPAKQLTELQPIKKMQSR